MYRVIHAPRIHMFIRTREIRQMFVWQFGFWGFIFCLESRHIKTIGKSCLGMLDSDVLSRSKLSSSYPEVTQKLFRSYSEAVQKLFRIYSEAIQKLFRCYSEAVQKLPGFKLLFVDALFTSQISPGTITNPCGTSRCTIAGSDLHDPRSRSPQNPNNYPNQVIATSLDEGCVCL